MSFKRISKQNSGGCIPLSLAVECHKQAYQSHFVVVILLGIVQVANGEKLKFVANDVSNGFQKDLKVKF